MQKFASKKKVNHGFPFAQKTITPKEPWREGGREREKKENNSASSKNTVWISERSMKRAATN